MDQSDNHIPDFIILTQGRSGSQYLVTLLDSHPDIHCTGELLGSTPIAPGEPDKELKVAFERIRAARVRSNKPLFGFKLPWGCLIEDTHLLRELLALGTRCIVLYRQNKLDMYLSMRLAQINNDWASLGHYAEQSLVIEPDHMMDALNGFLTVQQCMLEATHGWPRTLVTYEAIQAEPDVPWVQDFLGVPLALLSAGTIRARIGSQRSVIQNYHEISALLRDTPYGRFLDEVGA